MLLDPIQSRLVFRHALENQYAVLAVNADSHAALTDCLEAAHRAGAPLIIETSLWQLKGHSFGAGDPILGLARYLASLATIANSSRYHHIPVIFHTDHIKGPETFPILEAAIEGTNVSIHKQLVPMRASTISLDASDFTHEETVQAACRLCAFAERTQRPITLELEDAVDAGITSDESARYLLGSMEEQYPGIVHLWAPGTGTQHGFGEQSKFSPAIVSHHCSLAQEITGRAIGLALHGSTGLSEADLHEAARSGVVKVNWSSESLYLRNQAARAFYDGNTEKFDKQHPDWKKTVMDDGVSSYISSSYIPHVVHRMQVLGGGGQAAAAMRQIEVGEF